MITVRCIGYFSILSLVAFAWWNYNIIIENINASVYGAASGQEKQKKEESIMDSFNKILPQNKEEFNRKRNSTLDIIQPFCDCLKTEMNKELSANEAGKLNYRKNN